VIKLRFVTCNDAVSAGIRCGEYGFWASHAEAVMADGSLIGAHYDGGVQRRPKGYDAATLQRELIVPIPTNSDVEDKFIDFLGAQIGKPYDIDAIAALVVGRDWRKPDAWFCSELQAAALEACGWLPMLAADVSKITPRDLLLIASGRVTIPN
jgi:uncharacterized protein YycO